MDISDIGKVAGRKRINTDAEKLREKVSRETAKIIKLRVAQDTAYWDLKEKLHQLEANHERLQQNMVEVQMQHEAVSGQHQEELRLRPDTLNKLSGARGVCDVLEQLGERVRGGLARARADARALALAFDAAGPRVRELSLRLRRRDEALEAAREDAARAGAERDAREAELRAAAAASSLQAEAARATDEARRAAEERGEALARELRAAAAASSLQTEAARATDEARRAAEERGEALARELQAAVQREGYAAQRVGALEAEAGEARERLAEGDAARRELDARLAAAQAGTLELGRQADALRAELRRHEEHRAAEGARLAELAAERERELEERAGTVARLMADLKGEAQARYRAEGSLQAEREAARASLRAKDEEQAAQLALVLELRGDRERLQDELAGLRATLDNLRKELTAPAGSPPSAPPLAPERDQPRADELLYSFLSDGSVDSDALDAREVGRRFESLARGDEGGLGRAGEGGRGGPGRAGEGQACSLSQIKNELKLKGRRTYFKHKRSARFGDK